MPSKRPVKPSLKAAASGGGREPRFGVARVLSKRGFCSRSEAVELVKAGLVHLNGRRVLDPEAPVRSGRDLLEVNGEEVRESELVYLAMNKPRGLVVTASDEHGRETVFKLLPGLAGRHLSPVGRLDMASEGLLFFTNDTEWGARIVEPSALVKKRYHVHISGIPEQSLLERMKAGVDCSGEVLSVDSAVILRTGGRNAWVEAELSEGRNRHLRRIFEALGHEVLRLIRVAIGPIELGNLPKGGWRTLEPAEVDLFRRKQVV